MNQAVGNKEALGAALRRLSGCQQGERAWEDAWRVLFRQLWPLVRGISCQELAGVSESVEDASQEVFVRLLRYKPFKRITEPDDFLAYVRVVSRNVSRLYRRKIGRHGETPLADLERPENQAGTAEHDYAALADARKAVQRLRDALTPREQQLLGLVLEDTPIPEIAQKTGVSYANAAVRVHRLRRKLQGACAGSCSPL